MEFQQRDRFRQKLEENYGSWDQQSANFGNASYGDIARELCYSNSHFTKLISGSASDAMYERALKNINRIIKINQLEQSVVKVESEKDALQTINQKTNKQKLVFRNLLILCTLGVLATLAWQYFHGADTRLEDSSELAVANAHPFARYFDRQDKTNYASPYLDVSLAQDYCPCSAYEGTWAMQQEYRMPLPSRKPGLYYLAKAADVRMKCKRGVDAQDKGFVLLGFENIHNEIWLDKSRMPFSPTYFDPESKSYTDAFYQLDFETNEDFVKIADVYSCFFDEFTISPDFIERRGEPCGRYANVTDEKLLKEYDIDINDILNNVIGNMTTVKCNSAANLYCNPNDLKEGESVLNFDCMFSIETENLGLGGGYPYSKAYKLVEQNYSANLLCKCESPSL